MRLKLISIRNYRPFKSVDLELPEGMVSVMGPNGSGKSSLMEAVAWALYGNQTEIVRTGKENIKREGSALKDPCSVRIEFDFEGTAYIVERSMKGKGLTMAATMHAGDKLMARSSDDVTKTVDKLFGMDHKSFFISVFARQNELNALTSHPRHLRKKMVLRMLEIENIEDVIRRIREDNRFLRSGLESARKRLNDEDGKPVIERLEKENEVATKELATHKKSISKSQKVLEKLKKEQKDKKLELGKLENARKCIEELRKQKAGVESGIAGLEKNLKVLDKDIDVLAKLQRESEGLKEKAQKSGRELGTIEKKKTEAGKEREVTLRKITEFKSARTREMADIEDLKEKIDDIKALGPDSECPTCRRKLDETYKELLKLYNNNIKQKEKTVMDLDAGLEKAKMVEAEVSARMKALDKRESLLNDKVMEWEKVKARMETLPALKKRKKVGDEELVKLKKDLERIGKGLDSNDFNEDAYSEKRTHIDILVESMMGIERDLGELRVTEAGLRSGIKNLEKEIAELRTLQDDVVQRLEESEILQVLEGVMDGFKRHLMSRIRPALASISSELIADLTDGKYNDIELSEDYEISIRDGAEYHEIDRFSGGEKDLANLCLRLAISEVIAEKHGSSGFGFIVLDEIFGSQDSERKRSLLTTLNGLGNRFKQIFLITHVEDVKELMGNVIQVTEGSDGISTAEVL